MTKYNKYVNYLGNSSFLVGLGERNNDLRLKVDSMYTLFAKDSVAELENGESGHNIYSSIPMYLSRYNGGYGIYYIRNSNPMDIKINPKGIELHSAGHCDI